MQHPATPRFLAANDGDHLWYMNSLVTVKVTGTDTGGALSLLYELLPPGFETPYHVHTQEDETFYVLEGETDFVCDGKVTHASAGACIFLPRGIPHGFRVTGNQTARVLNLVNPAGFERFFVDLSIPAESLTLPAPTQPDIQRLLATCEKYGVRVIGPLDAGTGER